MHLQNKDSYITHHKGFLFKKDETTANLMVCYEWAHVGLAQVRIYFEQST